MTLSQTDIAELTALRHALDVLLHDVATGLDQLSPILTRVDFEQHAVHMD